jgi:hypothetical protein
LVAQAPLEHGFAFHLLSLFQELLGARKVDVRGCRELCPKVGDGLK